MGKISEIFNFDNIGRKIKNLTKWSCWITILLIWIAAPITLIVLLSEEPDLFWIPLVGAIVGPVLVWVESWLLYAFGEFVEDTHAMRKKYYPMAEEQANREAEEKAKREAEEYSWLKSAANQTPHITAKRCPYCGEIVNSKKCEMCGKEINYS